jgi:hypothetical protein
MAEHKQRSLGQFIGESIDGIIGAGTQSVGQARATIDEQRKRLHAEFGELEQEANRLSGQAQARVRETLRRFGIDLDTLRAATRPPRTDRHTGTGLRRTPTPEARIRTLRPPKPDIQPPRTPVQA